MVSIGTSLLAVSITITKFYFKGSPVLKELLGTDHKYFTPIGKWLPLLPLIALPTVLVLVAISVSLASSCTTWTKLVTFSLLFLPFTFSAVKTFCHLKTQSRESRGDHVQIPANINYVLFSSLVPFAAPWRQGFVPMIAAEVLVVLAAIWAPIYSGGLESCSFEAQNAPLTFPEDSTSFYLTTLAPSLTAAVAFAVSLAASALRCHHERAKAALPKSHLVETKKMKRRIPRSKVNKRDRILLGGAGSPAQDGVHRYLH